MKKEEKIGLVEGMQIEDEIDEVFEEKGNEVMKKIGIKWKNEVMVNGEKIKGIMMEY